MGRKLGNIDLTVSQRKEIAALLKRYLPDTEVWAYGSRVKFTAKPHSDLDMAAFASKEQSLAVANLKESFEESALPFRVDLFVWDEVPEQFHQNIEAEHVVLQVAKADSSLAEGWAERTLGDIADVIGGGTPSSKVDEYWGGDIPWLTPKDLSGYSFRRVKNGKRNITDLGLKKSSARLLPKNTVLVTSRAPIGYVALADNAITTNQGFKSLILKNGHDSEFFYYLIKHNVPKLELASSGTTFKEISGKAMKQIKLEVPPLPEQKAIAHILGSLDDKIELNRRMNETLEAMAQALFKSWFVDFEPVIDNALAAGNEIPEELMVKSEARREKLEEQYGSLEAAANSSHFKLHHSNFPSEFIQTEEMGWIPKGWRVLNFGTVSNCFDSKRIPLSKKQREQKQPGTIPYYGATSVMDYVNEWIFDDIYLLIGEDGSVLKEDGNPFVQYIWGQTWVNNHAHVLQGASSVSTEHLMLFMQSQNITAYVTGAVQLKINQKNMNSIPFLFADDTLNSSFAEQIDPMYQRIRQVSDLNKYLSKTRDTLLPQLLSGEIRIPEAKKLAQNLDRNGGGNGKS